MLFKQFYLPCLAHASYIIGDEAGGTATVVDPQRDTDQPSTRAKSRTYS
jgi:hydroxyacylglutathione hydrolase